MAKSVVERFEFRSLDAPEQWTEEFTPWCRRSPDTGQVMLVASDQIEAWLDKLADERWDALFAESQDVLASLAAQAKREVFIQCTSTTIERGRMNELVVQPL